MIAFFDYAKVIIIGESMSTNATNKILRNVILGKNSKTFRRMRKIMYN